MKIVVGLGNPGSSYEKNRHNCGKIVVTSMGGVEGMTSMISDVFMNNSGTFVRKSLRENNASVGDLYLVHDDWAFEVGDYKIQFGRGHNNHNGVKSVIDSLGTKDFWRVRVGIGMFSDGDESSEYVLSNFSNSELSVIKEAAVRIKVDLERLQKDE